ncbi:hypothetical protein KUCAC02_028866 [Chaenocephalus aceratus]|uniref:Uncharacterized protein n=1 Tax=Chaenocephalus aceratus TaxID=36190 RepID=A0ACB9X4B1_CHAAC|nr:hypothetical protein KUCAC02_028866 [Chaenocephalus aceratus]
MAAASLRYIDLSGYLWITGGTWPSSTPCSSACPPRRPRCGGVIWVLALLLALPQYYYSNTDQLPDRVVCYIDWPEYSLLDFKKCECGV